jgi:hypothetical protein
MGGIVKYPPTGGGGINLPPSNLPPSPPKPPTPPTPPSGSSNPPVSTVNSNTVVEQTVQAQINYSNMKIGYFKIDLYKTMTNMYGESVEKWYYSPVEVKCLIDRGDFVYSDTEYGPDVNQTIKITIPKLNIDTAGLNFNPEVGDIVTDQEKYYEIHTVNRSVVTLPGTGTSTSTLGTPGELILFVIEGHLTRITKLNLIQYS